MNSPHTLIHEIFNRFKAEPFGPACSNTQSALDELGKDFFLSAMHREVISYFGGAAIILTGYVTFNKALLNQEAQDADLSISTMFGVGGGKYSIEAMRQFYSGFFPSDLLPIAYSPWDDVFCIDHDGFVYFWDHESTDDSIFGPIADSFDILISALVESKDDDDTSEVIEIRMDPDLPKWGSG